MDYLKLNEEIDKYIIELKNTADFKKLIDTYRIIQTKYKDLITKFNQKKKELETALEYGKYYPNMKGIKKEYQELKADLYSKKEIKEYFSLLHSIEDISNETLKEIKKEIL